MSANLIDKKRREQNRRSQARFQAKLRELANSYRRMKEVFDKGKPFFVGFTVDEEDNLVPCAYAMTKTPASIPTAMKAMDKELVEVWYCIPLTPEEMTAYQIPVKPRTRVF